MGSDLIQRQADIIVAHAADILYAADDEGVSPEEARRRKVMAVRILRAIREAGIRFDPAAEEEMRKAEEVISVDISLIRFTITYWDNEARERRLLQTNGFAGPKEEVRPIPGSAAIFVPDRSKPDGKGYSNQRQATVAERRAILNLLERFLFPKAAKEGGEKEKAEG